MIELAICTAGVLVWDWLLGTRLSLPGGMLVIAGCSAASWTINRARRLVGMSAYQAQADAKGEQA